MNNPLDRLKAALSDRYTIERELGAGGMATVYLAEDVKHHRKVAVKVLRPELAATLGPERFLKEIEIAARLTHPHILPLHDSGEADGFLYYVMPYVEGESLRDKLAREGELPVAEATRILKEIVDALSKAHSQGVVHRDIKPDNVMLSDRHALVMDFGVAKAVSEATGREKLTTAGVALGTPSYMSPEQAAANPNIDHRADIYAIGALAYELLAGRPPFAGLTPQAILAAHVTETPDPVTDHRAAVPPAMAQLVMKCLEKKPADRWQSTDELLMQLEGLSMTPSGGMTPTDTRPIQVTTKQPRKATFAIGGVAVVVLVILGGVFLRPSGPSLIENRVMVAVFENETGDPTLDGVGKIAADAFARGLQDTKLVEIVDPRAALGTAEVSDGTSPVAAARALAERMGAATLVTGEYFRLGDSLRFQAQVLETGSGKIFQSLDPVVGGVADPMAAIGRLNQAIMASVASLFTDELISLGQLAAQPKSYEAYREYVTGRDLFAQGDSRTAMGHFQRSLTEDPDFVMSAIYLGALAPPRVADSIVSALNDKRDRLTVVERHVLDWLEARSLGDHLAEYRAMRRAYDLAPASVDAGWTAGYTATYINRPREALEILTSLDPNDPFFGRPVVLWGQITAAHHMLGQYEEELEAARRGREQFPDRLEALRYEAWALVGLGRLEELSVLMDEALTLPVAGIAPAFVMRTTAIDLRAHGYDEEATALLDRAIEWFEARPGERRGALAETLWYAGRWEDARDMYREFAEQSPAAYGNVGVLGIIAARLGEVEEARRIDDRLAAIDRPYVFGGPMLWRARIAASLGEQERAVNLLRDAFSRGTNYGIWLHRDRELALLRDYPPFQELLRPKG